MLLHWRVYICSFVLFLLWWVKGECARWRQRTMCWGAISEAPAQITRPGNHPLTHWVIPSTGPPNTCVLSGVIEKTGYNSKQEKWGFRPLGRLYSCRIKTRNNRHNEWSNCIIITRHRSYRKPSSIARGPGNCKITKPVRINIGVDPIENLISGNWLKWNKVEVWKKKCFREILKSSRTEANLKEVLVGPWLIK